MGKRKSPEGAASRSPPSGGDRCCDERVVLHRRRRQRQGRSTASAGGAGARVRRSAVGRGTRYFCTGALRPVLEVLLGLPNTVIEVLDESAAYQVGVLLATVGGRGEPVAGHVMWCGRQRGWPAPAPQQSSSA